LDETIKIDKPTPLLSYTKHAKEMGWSETKT